MTPVLLSLLALSDIHFDPVADCPWLKSCPLFASLQKEEAKNWDTVFQQYAVPGLSKYGHDTNYNFLAQTFAYDKNSISHVVQTKNIDVLLLNGDFLSHDLKVRYFLLNRFSNKGYEEFVQKIFEFLLYKVKDSLKISKNKSIIVLPVIGNHDSYADNYSLSDEDRTLYQSILKATSGVFSLQDTASFLKAGYYSFDIDRLQTRFIVLNSNFFSSHLNVKEDSAEGHKAQAQLIWLEDELQNSHDQGKKVILVSHIPATNDPHTTAQSFFKQEEFFWRANYQKDFLNLVYTYQKDIVTIMHGHIHSDALFVYTPGNSSQQHTVFSSLIPSISVDHSNNPGFKIFSFQNPSQQGLPGLTLTDIETYSCDLEASQSPSFSLEYSFTKAYKSATVEEAVWKLSHDQFLEKYFLYYNVGRKIPSQNDRKYYLCAMKYPAPQDYRQCIKQSLSQR